MFFNCLNWRSKKENVIKRRDFLRTAGCGTLGVIASGYLLQGNAAELMAYDFRHNGNLLMIKLPDNVFIGFFGEIACFLLI